MIRPVQIGDLFLIQRLGRQATKFATVEALLNAQSVFRAALSSAFLWSDARVTTYILYRREHGLANRGLLQLQKRAGRPEADILALAPALDTTWGHPAIWQKLLAHAISEAPRQGLLRLFADVPDQPLPVSTFSHVGFRVYSRQTIWRLAPHRVEAFPNPISSVIRPQMQADEWALQRLYARTTPGSVQQAEGLQGDEAVKPPILDWWRSALRKSYVLEEKGEIGGCLQIAYGSRGVWLQLWLDTHEPDTRYLHELLRFGLALLRQEEVRVPLYTGVHTYEGALSSVLTEYGFAPFTDRAKMVKQVLQWVRKVAPAPISVLDPVREVAPIPYTLPEE